MKNSVNTQNSQSIAKVIAQHFFNNFAQNPSALKQAIFTAPLHPESTEQSESILQNILKNNDNLLQLYFSNLHDINTEFQKLIEEKIATLNSTDDQISILEKSSQTLTDAVSWLKNNIHTPQQTTSSSITYDNQIISLESSGYYYGTGRLINNTLVKSGHGTTIYKVGASYEGAYSNNLPHGQGKLIYADGSYYEGNFVEGKRIGQGKLTFPNGDYHEGNFVKDTTQGHGKTRKTHLGDVYEGETYNNVFHGHIKITFANGNVYDGKFAEGKRFGQGKLTFPNGDYREGNFVENTIQVHGKTRKTHLGNVYEGETYDGKLHGHVKVTFADGNVYEAEYAEGKRIGNATLTSENGDVVPFDGKFSEIATKKRDRENDFSSINDSEISDLLTKFAEAFSNLSIKPKVTTTTPNPSTEKASTTQLDNSTKKQKTTDA